MSLIIKNLSKNYDKIQIIKDVSLEVKKGEILGIFGAVGEGKSTLMRAIAGLDLLNGGTITFNSQDLTGKPCDERGFHFPNLTNESFWKSVFKTDKMSQLADGEGQILALEAALKNAEDVLLLDNQFCYMDRQTRELNCEKLRQKVREKNLAVIFATNSFTEIFDICDRVAILHKGEIIQTGTPREVYEKPASTVAASVTGRNNLIQARHLTTTKNGMPEFLTVKGDHRLFTDKIEKNLFDENNEKLTLVIRPEHISISFGASFPEDNLLKAQITNIVFKGETTLIKLDCGGLSLDALVLRLVGLNIGEECMVGLPPDRIQVLNQ